MALRRNVGWTTGPTNNWGQSTIPTAPDWGGGGASWVTTAAVPTSAVAGEEVPGWFLVVSQPSCFSCPWHASSRWSGSQASEMAQELEIIWSW
jgi:hypothetical protein